MTNVIDFEAKRKQKVAEQKAMEKATKALRPSRVSLWAAVIFLAFIPWMTYFFVMWIINPNASTAQIQEAKLIGALMAMIISPLITIVAAQMVAQEYKRKNK